MALGTAFQHLADSLFVQLANFILLRRDSYLEYVKPGLKPDTWNKLRNAPLFTYGLFPDDVLAVAEQDIQKHESNKSATGPGPGTYQHSKKHHFRTTSHMKRKRVVNPAFHLLKINNLGGNFRAEAGVRVVVEVALALHTTPSLPVVLNHINDNQCLLSPPVVLNSKLGDLNLVSSANKVTFQETVNLHVVLPAPSVKGLLQKKKRKTLSFSSKNKICEQCFVCKSMSFCPKCDKCPVCCQRSTCERPSATVLAGLALPGFKSKDSLHPQGRVSAPLQGETTPSKISCNSQWFMKSVTKQKSERGIAVSRSKTGYRKGVRSVVSGFLQPVVPGSKTQQKMEAHSRSKPTEPVPYSGNVQDGNSYSRGSGSLR